MEPQVGRFLTDNEKEAWDEYEQLLDRHNELFNVKMYDRVSVHNAFPELKEAFENVRAMSTFYELTRDHDDRQED